MHEVFGTLNKAMLKRSSILASEPRQQLKPRAMAGFGYRKCAPAAQENAPISVATASNIGISS
jgi:hypothetical protein